MGHRVRTSLRSVLANKKQTFDTNIMNYVDSLKHFLFCEHVDFLKVKCSQFDIVDQTKDFLMCYSGGSRGGSLSSDELPFQHLL